MNAQRFALLTVLAGLPLAMIAIADDAPTGIDPAEEQAIRATVDKYFRGVVNADRNLIEEAWHTHGTYMIFVKSLGIPEPRFESVPINQAMENWTRIKAKTYAGKVLSLDVVENEMALVKFDFRYEHMHFIDYLTLLKLKEGWKIVNKSYVRIMPDKNKDKATENPESD